MRLSLRVRPSFSHTLSTRPSVPLAHSLRVRPSVRLSHSLREMPIIGWPGVFPFIPPSAPLGGTTSFFPAADRHAPCRTSDVAGHSPTDPPNGFTPTPQRRAGRTYGDMSAARVCCAHRIRTHIGVGAAANTFLRWRRGEIRSHLRTIVLIVCVRKCIRSTTFGCNLFKK